MERVVLDVGAGERGRPADVIGAEHVVVGEDVVKAMPGSRLAGSLRLCRQFPGLALAEALASRCEIVAPPGHG